MMRRCGLPIVLLLLHLAPCAAVAAPVGPHARAHRAARAGTAARRAAAPAAAVKHDGMPRTLDDVHIEGEIPVPQVLFITTRDPRRFMDFQQHRYLATPVQLGTQTALPTWLAVPPVTPEDPRKEISR